MKSRLLLHPVFFILAITWGNLSPPLVIATTALFEQGQTLFAQGEFEQAVQHWQTALAGDNLSTAQQTEVLIQLARAFQGLGLSERAHTTLLQAETLATKQQDSLRLAIIFVSLSDLALATRHELQAREYADKSVTVLPATAPPLIRATVLNNLGNVLTVEAYYRKAVETYAQCVKLAEQTNEAILQVRALVNMAYANFKDNQFAEATATLYTAWQKLEPFPDNYLKAFSLISIGELAQRIYRQTIVMQQTHEKLSRGEKTPFSPEMRVIDGQDLRTLAETTLKSALSITKNLPNNRLASYANGYLGQLYEDEQRYDEALPLTRQAIFAAQQNQAQEILYRWQWQLGRLFKVQRQFDKAIEAYRNAIKDLQPVRQELAIGYRNTSQSFRDAVGPVYFELADLLLQRAASTEDKNPWLKEARETIERLKTAELQDYFQDDCLVESQSRQTLLEAGIPNTAVIYPILLSDRTEILLSLPNGMQQITVPITANRLKDEVNEFRFELESHETTEFLNYAQRLYRWLIAPLESTLDVQKIDTLVIVPDGVLRTIPFAALHDGKEFLVTKYAIATALSLTLTDSKPIVAKDAKILLNGLASSVQGFKALANVGTEVRQIRDLYAKNATLLLDQDFTLDNFANALENTNYTIIHIASHGQFDSNPQKTYLLTHDNKLTVNRLEQLVRLSEWRNEPVELLTLSACQTAVGDDQAALGLAGMLLKAGARSSLATLWSIDDQASSLLTSEFYRQLQHPGTSKAKALQNAQKLLLAQSRFAHPAFWSAFLLIGNWL